MSVVIDTPLLRRCLPTLLADLAAAPAPAPGLADGLLELVGPICTIRGSRATQRSTSRRAGAS